MTGYNGAPTGMPHCNHDCDCESHDRAGQISGDAVGKHMPDCASRQPCLVSVHAEVNAIAYAARWGIPTEGAKLTTTDSPCLSCAQLTINAGIISVTYGRAYRDTKPLDLLNSVGIKVKSAADSPLI